MLNNHYIEKLLELKDVIVTNIKSDADAVHISIELKRTIHHCPECQQQTNKIHDYRSQTFKDIPFLGKNTYFHYRKRRYACKHCGKRFYEHNTFIPKYYRMTTRLLQHIIRQMKSTHSMTSIAQHCNLSIPTIFRMFRFVEYKPTKLPEVLAIDEFKGNAGRKYQGILTDPKNHIVLDILEGREQHILIDYFKPFKERNQVKYFVMDMWTPYKEIAETYFKNAKIVIDKYHFIRQVTWAFERVRKQEQKKFYKTRRKYFKRSRFLLLKRRQRLSDEQKDQVSVMLGISERLSTAYLLKEKFYEFIDSETKTEALKRFRNGMYLSPHSKNLSLKHV